MRNTCTIPGSARRLYSVRKKYNNLSLRISREIKDGSFYQMPEMVRRSMLRRLKLIYHRLLKLLNRIGFAAASLTTAFLLITGTAEAQTFTEQTGSSNPFNGVDVGLSSTPAFADIDGDGDMDAFFGNFDGKIQYYRNTGTALVPIFTELTGVNNPLNGDFGTFSSPAFADIDGDGDMDAFIGLSNGTIIYYKNTGTELVPGFTQQTGVDNPFNGIDFGSSSSPTFTDIDGDGDFDAFIGENDGIINYYKNTGTSLAPVFAEQTGANNPFNGINVGIYSPTTFADIDHDGDMDAFVGEFSGIINYYRNTGTALAPVFTVQTGANNPFNGVDVFSESAPAFTDIDGDGDMDAFIGESDGTINYFQNSTPLHTPSFSELTGVNNPLNGVDVGLVSKPAFADIDGDGDMDAFVGKFVGTINYYKNTGTAIDPVFTVQTGGNNPLNGEDIGSYSSPACADIDGDGDIDVFIGNDLGTISYYMNTGTPLAPAFTLQTGGNNPLNGIDVGFNSIPAFADIDGDGDLDLFIGENSGSIKYFRNTGTALAPVFAEQTGGNNPLNGVDAGINSSPVFLDLDNDGDLDLLIGESIGTLKYYRNTGTAIAPVFAEQTGANNPFNGVNAGGSSIPEVADIDGDGDMDVFIGVGDGTVKLFADEAVPLPVELTTFTAIVKDNSIVLNWQTATEVNNYGFEIEKQVLSSESGVVRHSEWKTIGFVKGNDNSSSVKHYSYADNELSSGNYSYRLKQIDTDGNFEYSKVVDASFMKQMEFALEQNYPNPFNPTTNFEFRIPPGRDGSSDFGLVTLKVYDVLGNEVSSIVNEAKEPGNYKVEWNASGVASGIYYYQLKAGEYTSVKKMILLR